MNLPDKRPLRYLITRGISNSNNFAVQKEMILGTISGAAARGIELVQIREKKLDSKDLFDLTRSAVELLRKSETLLLVNDRIDVVLAAGADGVHLTGSSVPVSNIRRLAGKQLIIGASVHTLVEMLRVREQGADLALYGPIFPTPGKPKTQGVKELEKVCSAAKELPVIAVGGVNEDRIDKVLEAGAAGYAAIRYFNEMVSL